MDQSSKDQPENKTKTPIKKGRFKYGEIPGIEPGARFINRKDCYEAGVHGVTIAGIHGLKETGAYSVCLSGAYEDDVDDGEFFTYAGTGGQINSYSGDHRHVADQLGHASNESLLVSLDMKQPVRVVRKQNIDSKWAPAKGYRYDGLYLVEKATLENGISGHLVWKFEFRRLPNQPPIPENPEFKDLWLYSDSMTT